MPITANIAPNIDRTQTADFQFTIEFVLSNAQTLDRNSFTLANVQLNMVAGTPVANTDPPEANYTVATDVVVKLVLVSVTAEAATIRAELPDAKSGTFNVDVTGSVRVDSASEGLTGTAKSINYDTMTSLGAAFGKPSYRGGGVLAIPVNFAFDVIEPSRTIFAFTYLSGKNIGEFDLYIVGSGRAYELILNLPRGASGTFLISASGTVFKTFSGTYDTVNLKPIFVAWSYLLAEISVLTEPKEVSKGIFEVEIETDLPTRSLDINSFSYKIPTESRILFRSGDLEERPDNPPLISDENIALPGCFKSWERVEQSVDYPSSRFFLLRFNREEDDDTHVPEVLFIGGDLE